MAAFKKGAFNVATKGNVPVVPIALIGNGKLMPNGLELTLRPGRVKVIIHPPIQGGTADELWNEARDIIAQTLLKYGMKELILLKDSRLVESSICASVIQNSEMDIRRRWNHSFLRTR
ncbi:unnamed protein product [Calypogeia fissa]